MGFQPFSSSNMTPRRGWPGAAALPPVVIPRRVVPTRRMPVHKLAAIVACGVAGWLPALGILSALG